MSPATERPQQAEPATGSARMTYREALRLALREELARDERVEERVEQAVKFASESPEPDVDSLAWGMHSQGSDVQFERMRPGSPFGEQELVFDGGLGK